MTYSANLSLSGMTMLNFFSKESSSEIQSSLESEDIESPLTSEDEESSEELYDIKINSKDDEDSLENVNNISKSK